jgi:superfamily I DNA/RNA helicase
MTKKPNNNLLSLSPNMGRAIARAGPVISCPISGIDRFVRFRKDRSLSINRERVVRRNCFVAVTRCQKMLTLGYADRYSGWSKAPSRFLREMGLVEAAQGTP